MRSLSGKGVGREIEPLLRKAKRRIWVASPFISEKYAKLLIRKANEGVDVRVITTSKSAKLLRSKKFKAIKVFTLLTSLLSSAEPFLLPLPLALTLYLFRLEGILVVSLGILISFLFKSHLPLVTFLSLYVLMKRERLKVAVTPKTFVHSKLYIIDDVAISGSANLTVSGLWRNYETVTVFEGKEAKELISLFKRMWDEISREGRGGNP